MGDRAPQLELPYAALHAPTHRELHVDSEEAVQYERRRVSRELESIQLFGAPRQSSEAPHTSPTYATYATLRSRNASLRDSGASEEQLQRHTSAEGESGRTLTRTLRWCNPVANFWNAHVSITIDEGAHRDHLALERTFLGYLRTSLILVMTGILIAQLFRLQHTNNPNPEFGFYVIGRPLSITFIGTAIIVMLVGAFRFWKLQGGLVRGMAYAGGWEVLLIMGLSGLLLFGTFVLVLGINIEKSLSNG